LVSSGRKEGRKEGRGGDSVVVNDEWCSPYMIFRIKIVKESDMT